MFELRVPRAVSASQGSYSCSSRTLPLSPPKAKVSGGRLGKLNISKNGVQHAQKPCPALRIVLQQNLLLWQTTEHVGPAPRFLKGAVQKGLTVLAVGQGGISEGTRGWLPLFPSTILEGRGGAGGAAVGKPVTRSMDLEVNPMILFGVNDDQPG